MPDFIVSLPIEIVCDIFSYLSQTDIIECMRVSHHWFNRIPTLTSKSWSRLNISPDSYNSINDCVMRCLGRHVHTVSIEKGDPNTILKKLKEAACDIRSLEISSLLAFVGTNVGLRAATFISNIRQFSTTLTQITIRDQSTHISPLYLLRNFHQLTHLTLMFGKRSSKSIPPDDGDPEERFDNLVYLYMDNVLGGGLKIVPILRRCPSIRSLLLKSDFVISQHVTRFDMFVELCPHLRNIMWSVNSRFTDNIAARLTSWRNVSKEDDDSQTGVIQELIFRGFMYQFPSIDGILSRSQHTLEFMELMAFGSFVAFGPAWPGTTADIQFKQLRTLRLEMRMTDRLIGFLRQCANLENLDILSIMDDIDQRQLIQTIASLKQLRTLRLHRVPSTRIAVQDRSWGFDLFIHHPVLEQLYLVDVWLSENELKDLPEIRPLRELHISMDTDIDYYIDTDSFKGLAEKLLDNQGNLQLISFRNCYHVTDDVLERLSQVKNLFELRVEGTSSITDAGVKTFTSAGKRMDVRGCFSISQQGL